MKLKSIQPRNFSRFGSTQQPVEIPDDLTLIIGENQDSDGADSNGSAKSSLVDCIDWTMLGEVVRDISKQEKVIRRGESEGSGVLEMTDGTDLHRIERGIGTKKVLTFKITHADNTLTDLSRRLASQTDPEIRKCYNFDPKKFHSDFLNTTYFSSTAVNGFASKTVTNAERIQIVTRFLGLEDFDFATKACKEMVDSLNASINLVHSKIVEIDEKLPDGEESFETYNTNLLLNLQELTKSRTEWTDFKIQLLAKKEQIVVIEKVQLQIQILEKAKSDYAILLDRQLGLEQQQDTLALSLTAQKKTRDSLKKDFVGIRNTHNAEISKLNTTIGGISNAISGIDGQLRTPLSCPDCGASLYYSSNGLKHLNTEALTLEKEKLVTDKANLARMRDTHSNIVTALVNEEKEFNKIDKVVLVDEAKLTEIDKQCSVIVLDEKDWDSQITVLKSTIPEEIDIEEVTNSLAEAEQYLSQIGEEIGAGKELCKNILSWIEQIKKYEIEILSDTVKVRDYSFWQITFPKIKQAIIQDYLPLFEANINLYLEKLQSKLKVELDLLPNSTGSRYEFSIIVVDEHGSKDEYENFSEGERRRIAIAVGFALRDLALSRKSLPFDFLIIDEIMDGLDDTGKDALFRLLQSMNTQILVISHSDSLKQLFNNIIQVVRKNGISTAKLVMKDGISLN